MKHRGNDGQAVPKPMQVQLSRLFGKSAALAKEQSLSDAQWRKVLRRVVRELEKYVTANIDSDPVHRLMLQSSFAAAAEALKEERFFPAYAEAITRLALLLMGDYPDHRGRKDSGRRANHYSLQACRSVVFVRNPRQRLESLIAAHRIGMPGCTKDPYQALREFRDKVGFKQGYAVFLEWFAAHYPAQYAASF